MNNESGKNVLLKCESVTKTFKLDNREIHVLRGIDLEIKRGEFISVVGPSGAGKSTLLHILGTLEKPTGGKIWINNFETSSIDDNKRAELRRKHVGFVFQFHHLLPAFTALENVIIPSLILGQDRDQSEKQAEEILGSMGLGERLKNKPAELSGGEQQRVAVARALINSPDLVLADEPSGNLDRRTGHALEEDLVKFARERGAAVLVVTHNEEWANRADRVLNLVDGSIN